MKYLCIVMFFVGIFMYSCSPPNAENIHGIVGGDSLPSDAQAVRKPRITPQSLFVIDRGLTVSQLEGLAEYAINSPDGVYKIGNLGKVVVSNLGRTRRLIVVQGTSSIPHYAFQGKKLTSVSIPNEVAYIGGYAFANNELTSVYIPYLVTRIENYAFSENKIVAVNIPDSVTHIGKNAFS